MEHNEKHGITPKGIKKSVTDIMQAGEAPGRRSRKGAPARGKTSAGGKSTEREQIDLAAMTPLEGAREIKKLEKAMYEHARNLEFEEAAEVRDRLEKVRAVVFGGEDVVNKQSA